MVNIFLVDDDPSIIKILSLYLQGTGYHVISTATNGQLAIEKYQELAEKPDIIIMDYRMPIKNGLEASLEILKQGYKTKILFASADFSIREQALEVGIHGFIGKPFEFKDLIDNIEFILNG